METVHGFGYPAAMRLVLAVVLALASCHRPPACEAPDAGDGGLTPLDNPCVKDGQPQPNGAACCLGASEGTCQGGRCVATSPAVRGSGR